MSALDDQIKALGVEMNAAKTTDATLAAVTKLLNVFIEQRSMMRMQMDMQGKMMEQMMSMHQMMQHMMSASPAGSATQPNGNDKVPH
jgi:ribosomal protein L12E/L44/L45/RPP1/RPP2